MSIKVVKEFGYNTITVQTHDGKFHADEIVGCAILSLFEDVEVIRSRHYDGEVDFRLDIGLEYDPERGLFDHHQAGGVIIDGRAMATAGLVWRYAGAAAVQKLFPGCNDEDANKIATLVYEHSIANIDAIDTGSRRPSPGEFSFSAFIAGINGTTPGQEGDFEYAAMICRDFIIREIGISAKIYQDRKAVQIAVDRMHERDEVLVFDTYFSGVIGLVQEINQTRARKIRRFVYPDLKSGWRCQVISGELPFPQDWRGKTEEDLSRIIPGMYFCHTAGLIAGAVSKEAAIEVAKKSLSVN